MNSMDAIDLVFVFAPVFALIASLFAIVWFVRRYYGTKMLWIVYALIALDIGVTAISGRFLGQWITDVVTERGP